MALLLIWALLCFKCNLFSKGCCGGRLPWDWFIGFLVLGVGSYLSRNGYPRFRFRYSPRSLDLSMRRVRSLPTRVKEIMKKLWDMAPKLEPSRVRLDRAFRGYCSRGRLLGGQLRWLSPASTYGACCWEEELLRLYDGDSERSLCEFLQSVRCRAQFHDSPSGRLTEKAFFAPAAKRLARKIVSGMNLRSLDYEHSFHGVLLGDVVQTMNVASMKFEVDVLVYVSHQ